MQATTPRTLAGALTLVAATSLLLACDRPGDARSPGEKLDANVASAEQRASEMGAQIKQAGQDLLSAAKSDGARTGDKARDASISAAVSARIAADSSLSALRVDVNTVDGLVVLHGSAPDAVSRDRAGMLASRVDGVVGVENDLIVASKQ